MPGIATTADRPSNKMKKLLLSICGPTGIGKTAWAIRLARHYHTEILSADSRQFYAEMRIGTAVPSATELREAPHHFIGHRSIHEDYSVGAFREDALGLMRSLYRKHDLLILVGGSGMYLDAVTRGLDHFPEVPPEIRHRLTELFRQEGLQPLQHLLAEKDPDYFREVDLQNPRRLIRALEVCLSSGMPYSSFRGQLQPPDFFTHIPLGIAAPREVVYKRIDARVDQMMQAGLLAEAGALYPYRHLNALQTVGYQELFAFLDGKYGLETAVSEIKKNTRRFAKRQGTWFRRNPDIHWFPHNTPLKEVTDYLDTRIKELAHGENEA